MKKRMAAMLAAAMVLTLGTTSVFAASSPTATTATASVERPANATDVTPADSQKFDEQISGVPEQLQDAEEVTRATVAEFDVEDITQEEQEIIDAGGQASRTLTISNVKVGAVYVVYHLKDDGTVEILKSVVSGNTLEFWFTDLSPIRIVEYAAVPASPTDASSDKTSSTSSGSYASGYDNGWWNGYAAGAASVTYTAGAASGVVASPKTAEAASIMPVLALMCAAGAAFCTRKSAMGR